MSSRLRRIILFNVETTLAALAHFSLGLERIVLRHSRDRFISSMAAKGLPVEAAPPAFDRKACCGTCGYAIAAVVTRPGWNVYGCSATSIRSMLKAGDFHAWAAKLPEAGRAHEEARETHLQTSGH